MRIMVYIAHITSNFVFTESEIVQIREDSFFPVRVKEISFEQYNAISRTVERFWQIGNGFIRKYGYMIINKRK